MKKLFQKSLTFILLLSSLFVVAQKTIIYTDDYKSYRDAQELYDKEKYSAAQIKFQETIYNIDNIQDEVRVNAEFYYAVCALELFHKDTEVLLNRFVLDHPDHPKSEKVHFQLGRYYYRLKKFKKSIQYFSKVKDYTLTEKEKIEYHFKLAYAYFYKKQIKESKPHFNEVLAYSSEYRTPALYYFSHIAYIEGNLQTALNGFLSIGKNSMFKTILPYYITQIYHKQKQFDKLIIYAPIYLDSINNKRKGEFAKLIGDAYYNNEDYDSALPYFKIFKKYSNATREDNYQVGYSYYRSGQYEGAAYYFTRVTNKTDGLSQTATYHMADCYLKLDKKDYARTAFKVASELNFEPEIQKNSLFNYAKLAYELSYNPYDEAVEAFLKFINTYPKSSEIDAAYEFLLKVYMTTRNYDAALESLDRIKNKDNRMKSAYQTIVFNRAVELFHNQSYHLARDHFKSVKKYPINKKLNANSIFWMAECSYKLKEYNKAIGYYKDYKFESGAALTDNYNIIDYSIGYSYFNAAYPYKEIVKENISETSRINNIKRSIEAFRSFTIQDLASNSNKLKDAFLRIADGYYLIRENELAIEYYEKAITTNIGDLSYAYFQKSRAQGLIQDYESKKETLRQLTEKYPNSKYQILSLLHLAQTYNELGENNEAISSYKAFISKYPNNSLVASSLIEIAGINLKTKDYMSASKHLLQVLEKYPDAENERLLAIELMKDVFIGGEDLPGYYSWLSSEGLEINQSERDSSMWSPVQRARDEGDCNAQIAKANQYLANINNPRYELAAHYYIANCLYANGKNKEALVHYSYLINKPNNNYYNEALMHASNICYLNKDYKQALAHYSTIENIVVSQEDMNTSIIGQMRCFWFLENYQSTIEYCNYTLTIKTSDNNIKSEALLYKGLSLKYLEQYDSAFVVLKIASELNKSKRAANAKYNMCEILYTQGKYELCETEIMELVKQKPSYDYFLAKAIILLGDNFVALEDYFNAKHSLQSIIDNYSGQDKAELVKIAQDKIDEILIIENPPEEIKNEEVEIDFNNIDQSDADLFETETQINEEDNIDTEINKDENTDENEK